MVKILVVSQASISTRPLVNIPVLSGGDWFSVPIYQQRLQESNQNLDSQVKRFKSK